ITVKLLKSYATGRAFSTVIMPRSNGISGFITGSSNVVERQHRTQERALARSSVMEAIGEYGRRRPGSQPGTIGNLRSGDRDHLLPLAQACPGHRHTP